MTEPRKDLTDITLVVDRSGSMGTCKDEAQGGINAFIEEQKQVPGEALFTLLQFDTTYDFVYNGQPIGEVIGYELVPRGMTALLDAVGKAINETGDRLSKMNESKRPGLVIMAIVTDGHENSSHEFTKNQIKKMIECQTNDYQWKFVFLGADAQAFDDAESIGIHRATTMSYDPANTKKMYNKMSSNVANSRLSVAHGGEAVMNWTEDQREDVS